MHLFLKVKAKILTKNPKITPQLEGLGAFGHFVVTGQITLCLRTSIGLKPFCLFAKLLQYLKTKIINTYL